MLKLRGEGCKSISPARKRFYLYLFMCMCVGSCMRRQCPTRPRDVSSSGAGVPGGFVTCLFWVMGTKLWTSARAASVLNYWVSSAALTSIVFIFESFEKFVSAWFDTVSHDVILVDMECAVLTWLTWNAQASAPWMLGGGSVPPCMARFLPFSQKVRKC